MWWGIFFFCIVKFGENLASKQGLRPNDAELIASLAHRHVTRPVLAFLVINVIVLSVHLLGNRDGRSYGHSSADANFVVRSIIFVLTTEKAMQPQLPKLFSEGCRDQSWRQSRRWWWSSPEFSFSPNSVRLNDGRLIRRREFSAQLNSFWSRTAQNMLAQTAAAEISVVCPCEVWPDQTDLNYWHHNNPINSYPGVFIIDK
jgi:hypothetical protein